MNDSELELINEFVIESREGLADVEQQMLEIESNTANLDTDLVNAVFRTMHSIKGAAGFFGLTRIGALAHGLEELLDSMRNGEIIPTSSLITSMLNASDYMTQLIEDVNNSEEADVTSYIADLENHRAAAIGEPASMNDATSNSDSSQLPGSEPGSEETSVPVTPPVNGSDESTSLSIAVREFLVECFENLDQMDHDILTLDREPNQTGLISGIFRTIHTVKGGAGFLGLQKLERLAHVAEDLLGQLRSGERTWNLNIASALLVAVDKCREALQIVEAHGSDANLNPEPAIEQLLLVQGGEPTTSTQESSGPTKTPLTPTNEASPAVTSTAPAQDTELPTTAGSIAGAPDAGEPATANEGNPIAETSSRPASESTIRVDVGLLDKLMTRVGELVLARNQILQYTADQEDTNFTSTAQRLNLITTELQEDVMKTRMQPIGNVWAKFPRVVRDLSSSLGKQVRIELEGKETELDKTIVEAIKDPLTHLVRNSVDHGIESPSDRVGQGKPAEGCICLRAYHEGGQVNIEIEDDGAGLNIERIRQKGIERGLVSAEQAAGLSDREVSQLILQPGFSTAEQITSVSGRGVGMDVVKTNIERLGGTIDIDSCAGQGTTINIKIPLTLAIIPALIVTSGRDRYAIPQVSLLELVRLEGEQIENAIEYVHGAPVYRLRGRLLPLINLAERLRLHERDPEDKPVVAAEDASVNIVVLRANDRQFGLIVDGINDTEEIVVKPLSRQLKALSEYSGATIMGDGTVALILDVAGIALAAGLAGEVQSGDAGQQELINSQSSSEARTLLVVESDDRRRFALPTSMVSRLERIASNSIEFAESGEVIQYRGAILPLARLSEICAVRGQQESIPDELQLVVYSDQDHSFGLVVRRIVDIVNSDSEFQTTDRSDDRLLGSTVIQDRVTDVLNLPALAKLCSQSPAYC